MTDKHSQKPIYGASDLDDQMDPLVDHNNNMAEGNDLSSIANDLTTFEIENKFALSFQR